jgi:pyridoxamine 5'-phosphate oxidase
MNKAIADIRKDYTLKSLLETDVAVNPFSQFNIWWQEAIESEIDEVNAMSLATLKSNGMPSVRTVLLKDFSADGLTFFTNYLSAKGQQIEQNNKASICIFWKELQRQIRVEGVIEKVSERLSDEYFNSRPLGSKLGAWASPQSQIIASRTVLENNEIAFKKEFGEHITRPAHWGGYIIKPNYFEFWQGRSNRLHDRICYALNNDNWIINRLAP